MEYFLSKVELWWFATRVSNSLSGHSSVKSVFLESFEYFTIRGDLEEISNMKSVSNSISYYHEKF
jgi:hypothetical protein